MNIKVFNKPNVFVECMELLMKHVNQESPRKYKGDLIQKYDVQSEVVEEMFIQIIEVYDHVVSHLDVSQERLAFFFATKEEMNWCCAHLLLMDRLYHQSDDIHQLLMEAHQGDKGEWMNRYAKALISHITDHDDESTTPLISNEQELFQIIDSFEIDFERKWLCMQVYQNYESYLHELFAILNQAASLYEQKMHLIQPLLDEFQTHYEKIVEQQSASQLFSSFKMTITDTSHDLHIYPNVMGFNSARLDHSNRTDDFEYLYTGVLFDKLSMIVHEVISDESICKQLKILSDTSKYAILKSIRDMPAYGQELAERLNLTTATISHHMNALINSGFIKIEKRANRVYYQMDKDKLSHFLKHVYQNLISSPDDDIHS